MHLLVGLGNPGECYTRNRHNVGFHALDRIAERYRIGPFRSRFAGLVADGRIGPHRVLLQKPLTFMNESGRAVGAAVRFFKLDVSAVIVFHDEIDLAPGKVRVRVGGGLAGHRGLASIRANVGEGFRRVRIGVGRPGESGQVIGHVLGNFAPEDSKWWGPLLDGISDSLEMLLEGEDDRFSSTVGQIVPRAGSKESEETAEGGSSDPAPE